MEVILQGEKVYKYFGKFAAVKDLDFQVYSGEIFGIAGPNGAGKTTLFNVITNVPFSLTSGRIKFRGRDISRLSPYKIFRMGIARTFQIPINFKTMTVLNNLRVGGLFGGRRSSEKEYVQILDFSGLLDKKDVVAENLSLLDKKRLMIASGFVAKPSLLLLDEPVSGLNPTEVEQIVDLIRGINKEGITVIIIEHIMKALMGLSNRIMILHHGEKICEGPSDEVTKDEKVIDAYLGRELKHR